MLKQPFSLVSEQDFAVRGPLAGKATLVNKMMMVSAEQYQVVQARFSAIGPVLYVVSFTVFILFDAHRRAIAGN
jgi:hypothetical protein